MDKNTDTGKRAFDYRQAARLVILAGLVYFAVTNISFFLLFLRYLLGVLAPVIIGLFLAFTLNLPLTWLERRVFVGDSRLVRKVRRPLAMFLSVLLLVGILALVVILVIPQSVEAIQVISKQIPSYWDSAMAWIKSRNIEWLAQMAENFRESNDLFGGGFLANAGSLAGGLFKGLSGVLGGLMSTLLGLSFAIFMLISKETLLIQLDRAMEAYMSPQLRTRIKYFLGVTGSTFRNYIVGQVTEALVIGVLTTVLMMVLGFPYATVIGPLTGLSSLIPMIGALLGGVVGFLLILTVSPVQAVLFVVFIFLLQQIDGMFIYPRVVGASVDLPPLWVFFAVTVGGALFGFIGTFLGVPTMATIYRLIRDNINRRIKLQDEGAIAKYQILKIPKGTEPVWLNEPDLVDLADPEVDTSDFLPGTGKKAKNAETETEPDGLDPVQEGPAVSPEK